MKTLGVLALQGAFKEHIEYVKACIVAKKYDLEVLEVKTSGQLDKCDALIIPGGESTAMSLIAGQGDLLKSLEMFVRDPKKAVWGTCAGLILLAQQVSNEAKLVKPLGVLGVSVQRNAFGRQAQSFVGDCDFSGFMGAGEPGFPAVFIRAPVIDKILDPENVEVLHSIQSPAGGDDLIVAVRQKNVLGTSFHPELADDIRFHDWFLREFVV